MLCEPVCIFSWLKLLTDLYEMLETNNSINFFYENLSSIWRVTLVATARACTKASHSHFSEVLGHSNGGFVEGVASRRAVRVNGPDSFWCDDFVVCGVTCSILDHIELKAQRPTCEIFHQPVVYMVFFFIIQGVLNLRRSSALMARRIHDFRH